MNREILFRGKRIDNGEWVEGFYFELCYDGINTPCIGIEPLSANDYGEIFDSCYEMVDPSTVGQYTGLTDKNGVRIFEGDIVYISDWESMTEVYWRGGAWLLKFDDSDEYLYDISKDCEVIGNIHDGKDGRHDEL